MTDTRTLTELDDAIEHLTGATAALRDLRARLAVGPHRVVGDDERIGDRVRAGLAQAEISHQVAARRMSMTIADLRMKLDGVEPFDGEELESLAALTGCSVRFLVRGTGRETP